jgi:hypothetical protein
MKMEKEYEMLNEAFKAFSGLDDYMSQRQNEACHFIAKLMLVATTGEADKEKVEFLGNSLDNLISLGEFYQAYKKDVKGMIRETCKFVKKFQTNSVKKVIVKVSKEAMNKCGVVDKMKSTEGKVFTKGKTSHTSEKPAIGRNEFIKKLADKFNTSIEHVKKIASNYDYIHIGNGKGKMVHNKTRRSIDAKIHHQVKDLKDGEQYVIEYVDSVTNSKIKF